MGFCSKTLHKYYILLRLDLYFRCETRIIKKEVVQDPDCFRLIMSK